MESKFSRDRAPTYSFPRSGVGMQLKGALRPRHTVGESLLISTASDAGAWGKWAPTPEHGNQVKVYKLQIAAMCTGIALPIDELPEELVRRHQHRLFLREPGTTRELRFLYRDPRAELPVWYGSRLVVYPWGNRHNKTSALPRTGWCNLESLEDGYWQYLGPEPVEIPAVLGLERSVWFLIGEGIRGILVRDEHRWPHVYMLTQPASHYYQIMTRSPRMPVLLGEQI